MLHHRRIFAMAFLAVAFTPATAFAASATQDGYDDDNDVTVQPDDTESNDQPDSTPSATPAPSATNTTSNLPFTGLEAGLIAAAGLGLAGTGIVLRRAVREND